MLGESMEALRMVSMIVWMYPSTKTMPPKIWQWFGILRFPHESNSPNPRELPSSAKEKSVPMTWIISLLPLTYGNTAQMSWCGGE